MFRSKEINCNSVIEAPPSPAAVAAGVKRSAAHAELAERIAKLEAERQAAFDEMRALIATNSGEQNDPQIRKAGKRREKIEETTNLLRREIRPLRAAHAQAVRSALRPQGVEAAKVMISALAAFVAAAQLFNACEEEIERAGGEPERLYLPANLGAFEHFARAFVDAANG